MTTKNKEDLLKRIRNAAIEKGDKANMFMLKWAKLKTNFDQHVKFMKTIKTS